MTVTGVVLPYWADRPALEALEVAAAAERAGYAELWVGEMATFDAFALAGAIVARTPRITPVVGPLAVGVRDPVAIALGVASVATLGARAAHVALGVSTPVLVQAWHGRPWERNVTRLRETATAVRALLAGERVTLEGSVVRTSGFRLRLEPPASEITIAAFGDGSIAAAAALADRMVINLVTTRQASVLRDRLERAARAAGRPAPTLTAWLVAAVDPTEETMSQIRSAIVAYLGAPGYGEMFADAGFGEIVARARGGAHPKELLASIPTDLIAAVAAVGDERAVRARIAEYRAAGVDAVAIVPATAGTGLEATLATLRHM